MGSHESVAERLAAVQRPVVEALMDARQALSSAEQLLRIVARGEESDVLRGLAANWVDQFGGGPDGE